MGKFDKKVAKHEPDAPGSQKILKKKSNSALAALSANPKAEKDRSMKILGLMQRADEIKTKTKADAHLADPDKVIRNKIRKQEKKRNFIKPT